MKSLLALLGRRPADTRAVVMQVAGLGLIDWALGMWLLPVGIAAAGVSLLILEYLARPA